jgi:hypothetical protein
MKYKDWSDFAVHCASISEIMSRPKGATDLTPKQRKDYEKLIALPEPDERQQGSIDHFKAKIARHLDPELSLTAIKQLYKRYAWEKYNRRVVSLGKARPCVAKGNELEADAIIELSKIDKVEYAKCTELVRNEYMIGCCDVWSPATKKILEIKTQWNINTFLPQQNGSLSYKYWLQMQGYLELYNVPIGEVCFVLLNTPPHLIDRERAKYTEKYVFGEIDREKYDEEMEKLDLAYDYNKIPIRRRIIRFQVERYPDIMPKIYRRVERCRDWLNEFEKIHLSNTKTIVLPTQYGKEDNAESDAADARENDTE